MKVFNFILDSFQELSKISWVKSNDLFVFVLSVLIVVSISCAFFATVDVLSNFLIFSIL